MRMVVWRAGRLGVCLGEGNGSGADDKRPPHLRQLDAFTELIRRGHGGGRRRKLANTEQSTVQLMMDVLRPSDLMRLMVVVRNV